MHIGGVGVMCAVQWYSTPCLDCPLSTVHCLLYSTVHCTADAVQWMQWMVVRGSYGG